MRRHRLERLAALTRGVALVGIGTLAAACTKDNPPGVNAPDTSEPHVNAPPQPTETIHMNATATPPPSASAAPSAAPSASESAAPKGPPSFRPRIINAPPKNLP